jgi:hypothetical protein
MHSTHSPITGDVPARPACPVRLVCSTRPSRPTRSAHRRFRPTPSLAALFLAIVAILGLVSLGCDPDRAVAGPDRAGDKDHASGIAAITIDDLPATLNLSADQRTRLAAAIAGLRQERPVAGHRFSAGGRGRGHDGAGPRDPEKRGPGARMHRGVGPGSGAGPCRGNGLGNGSGPGNGDGPAAGFEPPVIRFVEKASSILNGDQFVILAHFLTERRAELRPDSGNRPVDFDGPLGRFAARRLGLTEAEQDQLRPLFTAFGDGMRQVRDGVAAGTLTPEQARDRCKELRLTLAQSAQGILTPEQWKQVQTFREEQRGRRSERREDAQPKRVDHVTGRYVRILGLDDAQASKVRQIMAATIPAPPRARGTERVWSDRTRGFCLRDDDHREERRRSGA